MRELRRLAMASLIWTADRGIEVGSQLYRGWLLAYSDRDIRS